MPILQNIPPKLKRKFAVWGITTVEDLQSKYYALICSKGFGGIFLAELKKYIEEMKIHIPYPVEDNSALNNLPDAITLFSFNPLPPKILRNALISISAYSIEDLKNKYQSITFTPGFGEGKLLCLIEYMKKLGLERESNDLQINYLPFLGKIKTDQFKEEKFFNFESINSLINDLIKKGADEFFYRPPKEFSKLFNEHKIQNFSDLKNNYALLRKTLYTNKKLFNKLKNWLDDINCIYQSESHSEIGDIFRRIKDALGSFCGTLNPKDKYICEHFFENPQIGYITISQQLGISRERIRQLCNKYKSHLSIYVLGANLGYCNKIEPNVAKQIHKLKISIEKAYFLSLQDAVSTLSPMDLIINEDKIRVIKLLCYVWDFNYCELEYGNSIFITSSLDISKKLSNIASVIFKFFQQNIYPVSYNRLQTLIQQDNLTQINSGAFKRFLTVLNFLDYKDDLYALKLRYYSKFIDMAAIILNEEKGPLKIQTIINRINSTLIIQGAKPYDNRVSIASSPELVHLGRTGYWVHKKYLKESDEKTLKNKIIDEFKKFNRPLSARDLKNSIKGLYAEQSISTILYMETGKTFISLNHNRYILSEWEPLYSKEIKNQKKEKIISASYQTENVSKKIIDAVITYFEDKNTIEEPMNEVVKYVYNLNNFEKVSIYKAISSSLFFSKIGKAKKILLHYNKNEEEIMSDLLTRKKIKDLLCSLLQKQCPDLKIVGQNPYHLNFCGKEVNIYVKNITDTDALAKARGNYRVQLPYRTEFEEMKRSSLPFILLGFNAEYNTFASWHSSVIKLKLNTKSNVSLYPRIVQMEMARKEMAFKTVRVNGEGDVISFPCEFLPKFIQEELFISPDPSDFVANEENYEAEYEQNGLLKKITNPHLIQLLQPILQEKDINRYKAFEIIWNFYGTRYPLMKLSHWGKLLDRLSEDNKKSSV